jgi:hypothetical protein
LRFVNYGKKLAESEEAKIDYKKSLEIKKICQEISVIELEMWYEDSIFRKVSGIEFNEHIARTKYELYLSKNYKHISDTLITNNPDKPKNIYKTNTEVENEDADKPLFTIKFKK